MNKNADIPLEQLFIQRGVTQGPLLLLSEL